MAKVTLAVKYRPKTFDDVTEQDSIKIILKQQLESGDFQHAYLFVGGAGTGKTTCARIFASEINKHEGEPIELDAASNSGVDDVRNIIQQAKTKSLDSEYKVFIIDECHSLSNTAWQAFLKLIEEPPAKSIFIFATTNPEKIPKTIISRVQRYDFRRISQQGIVDRLLYILCEENEEDNGERGINNEAVEYLAKLADGGMRTAISLMDKCLSYSSELTVENVVKALGVSDYATMRALTLNWCIDAQDNIIRIIEKVHADGIDLKQFIRQYINFVLDIKKYLILDNFDYLQIPQTDDNVSFLKDMGRNDYWNKISDLLDLLVKINTEIKYDSSPKYLIESMLLGGINE
jgi:DNA polymerase-3 subunit gamma/tau